jgi:WhiB family redox-sensing transcriptional regulator
MTITWETFAACPREDPELFYPKAYGSAYAQQIADAKAVCARCPVRSTCLVKALEDENGITDARYRYGIRGGRTPIERQKIASSRRLAAA